MEPAVRQRRLRLVLAYGALGAIGLVLLLTSRNVRSGGTTGDFPVFFEAGRKLLAGENIYTQVGASGYIYGPFPALLFAPFTRLGPAGCAWVLGIANIAMLWLAVAIGAREALRRLSQPLEPLLVGTVGLLGLILSIDKARAVVSGGQTDMLVVLPLILALAWQRRAPVLAGVALGFAANIKYISLAFLPYLLFRRQWTAAIATVVSSLVFALAPALVSGWDRNLEHWRMALAGMGHLVGADVGSGQSAPVGDVTRFNSISITSTLGRWLIPTYGRGAAYAATAAAAVAVLGACWLVYRRQRTPLVLRDPRDPREPALGLFEWTGIIVALLAFSPQTQGRHFVLLLPLHLAAAVMLLRPRVPRLPLILGLLLMQAGLNLPPASLHSMEHAVEVWRTIGGASWCLLGMFLLYLGTGLRTANAIEASAAKGRPI